jgi:hypothetical protein
VDRNAFLTALRTTGQRFLSHDLDRLAWQRSSIGVLCIQADDEFVHLAFHEQRNAPDPRDISHRTLKVSFEFRLTARSNLVVKVSPAPEILFGILEICGALSTKLTAGEESGKVGQVRECSARSMFAGA